MEENNVNRIFTAKYFDKMKDKFFVSKQDYRNKLKELQEKYVHVSTWKDNVEKYQRITEKYKIKDFSDCIIYEIFGETNSIIFFINPETQQSKIFVEIYADIYQMGYGHEVQFPIDTVLNYPIFLMDDKKMEMAIHEKYEALVDTKSNKKLFRLSSIYLNYSNEKFDITNENVKKDIFVITLENLCPEIRRNDIQQPKLKTLLYDKLYQNHFYKYQASTDMN
jgi:hypothetical protein